MWPPSAREAGTRSRSTSHRWAATGRAAPIYVVNVDSPEVRPLQSVAGERWDHGRRRPQCSAQGQTCALGSSPATSVEALLMRPRQKAPVSTPDSAYKPMPSATPRTPALHWHSQCACRGHARARSMTPSQSPFLLLPPLLELSLGTALRCTPQERRS